MPCSTAVHMNAFRFTALVEWLEQGMQAATVAAASGSAASAHASPVSGVYSAHPALPAPGQLPMRPQTAAASGATPADGSAQPIGSSASEAALLAQLPGGSAEEKLSAAVVVIANMQREVEELRNRNRALAQDLVQATSSTATNAGGSKTPPAGSELEARVQAQLRASRAEMEVGALRCVHGPSPLGMQCMY